MNSMHFIATVNESNQQKEKGSHRDKHNSTVAPNKYFSFWLRIITKTNMRFFCMYNTNIGDANETKTIEYLEKEPK